VANHHHTPRRLESRRLRLLTGERTAAPAQLCKTPRPHSPKDSNAKLTIPYSDIAALAFTGRDTAAGKSWEAWMKNIGKRSRRRKPGIALDRKHWSRRVESRPTRRCAKAFQSFRVLLRKPHFPT